MWRVTENTSFLTLRSRGGFLKGYRMRGEGWEAASWERNSPVNFRKKRFHWLWLNLCVWLRLEENSGWKREPKVLPKNQKSFFSE
jgi:hypothetical protein